MDPNLTIALCAVLVAYYGVAKPLQATTAENGEPRADAGSQPARVS